MTRGTIAVFLKYKHLLLNMISRDLKVKYRRSVLGVLWSLLNPILMMLVLNAVFSRILDITDPYFPLYLVSGQILFSFFNEATSGALGAVVDSSALIKKIYLPKYIFPLEKALFAFVNLLFSMVAILVMLAMFRVRLTWAALLFPVPLLALLLFAIGFGMILATLCVYFRDIRHLYTVVTMAWMYMTPILYQADMLGSSWVRYIVALNPLTHYIDYFRSVVIYGTLPAPKTHLICFGYSLVFLFLGFLLFKKKQDDFILHI